MLSLNKRSKKLILSVGLVIFFMTAIACIIPDLYIVPKHIPCCLFMIVLAIVNYWVGGKDVFYPGLIYSAIWAAVFCFYTFSFVEVINISLYTDVVFAVGSVTFSISCYFSQYVPAFRLSTINARPIRPSTAKFILVCYVLVVMPFFYRDIVSLTGGNLSLTLIRVALVDSTTSGQSFYTTPFTRVLPLTSVMVAIVWFIADRGRKRSRWSYAVAFLSFLIALLTTGRPQIIQLCISLPVASLFVYHRGLSLGKALRMAALPLLAMVLVISLIPLLTKTTAPDSGSSADLLGYAASLFVWYIMGSLAAFDIFLRYPFPLGAKLDFVNTPFGINTYTAYLTPYQIAGFTGIIIFGLLIGFAHGYIYKFAKSGSDAALFVYAISLYPLVMSMFSDQYFSIGFYFYLEIIVFAVGYYCYLRRFVFFPSPDALSRERTAVLKGSR